MGEKACVFHHYPEVEEEREEGGSANNDVCEQRGTACSRLLEIREREGRRKTLKFSWHLSLCWPAPPPPPGRRVAEKEGGGRERGGGGGGFAKKTVTERSAGKESA